MRESNNAVRLGKVVQALSELQLTTEERKSLIPSGQHKSHASHRGEGGAQGRGGRTGGELYRPCMCGGCWSCSSEALQVAAGHSLAKCCSPLSLCRLLAPNNRQSTLSGGMLLGYLRGSLVPDWAGWG